MSVNLQNYKTYSDDSNKVRIYKLKNGLTVYLAQNFDEPRIQTFIPVRTGSNNDPADNTGLAHYLEHMMFKGTSRIGTLDWKKEKPLLDQISDLYEKHKAEQDSEKKKVIYKKIDQVSQEAAKYVSANEYDKLCSVIGASGTNAHTWFDETVYKNNIPSNELEHWLQIESERFSELVLRLFHTELEAVYEEFNRAQDNDSRLVFNAMLRALFPHHPNGQQTTLGSAEHLRNPSMVAIHQYFDKYYVPNNFALILVGDLDFDKTIQLIDHYFGVFRSHEITKKEAIIEPPLTKIQNLKVNSPSAPRLHIGWRTESYGTQNSRLFEIISQILSNSGETGLLDIDINQKQKALRAEAYNTPLKNYGYFSMVILPKDGQTLDQAKDLLLAAIERIKAGDFPDWLIPAIQLDLDLAQTEQWEKAKGLAESIYDSFIRERQWGEEVAELEQYKKITKAEVVAFANGFFADNYVLVYKEQGENKDLIRVENPGITPVQLNKDAASAYLTDFQKEKVPPIQPVFVDYGKEIATEEINGIPFYFVENRSNNLAEANFVFDFGADQDKELALAVNALGYFGMGNLSVEEVKAEFYKIGVNYDFKIDSDRITLQLSGPEENIADGVKLLFRWFKHVEPDQEVYRELVNTILDTRAYNKQNKNQIAKGLISYAKYGANSRFKNVVSEARLNELTAEDLTKRLKDLLCYPYDLFYYGKDKTAFATQISNDLQKPIYESLKNDLFAENETMGKVYFANYDMVQVDFYEVARANFVNLNSFGNIRLYNEYFGQGLSSIVFQEIRESRSLAYSTYVSYVNAGQPDHHDYITSYVGTQTDKLPVAVEVMNHLIGEMPMVETQFKNAKENVLKQLASGRIKRRKLFLNYLIVRKFNLTEDIRRQIFKQVESTSLEDLNRFAKENVKNCKFNFAILGNKKILNGYLKQFNDVKELSLEDLFGY